MFGRQRKGGEKLDEYLDNHLGHSYCRGDLRIDVEAIQKVFDRLEQVGQRIVAISGTFDRLIGLDVTKMRVQGLKKAQTESRRARPVCIAVTGGKCYIG